MSEVQEGEKCFYLFVGSLRFKKITDDTIDGAYKKALELYAFKEVKALSKTSNSIFFNATLDGILYRCSVSDKSVVNEDELEE